MQTLHGKPGTAQWEWAHRFLFHWKVGAQVQWAQGEPTHWNPPKVGVGARGIGKRHTVIILIILLRLLLSSSSPNKGRKKKKTWKYIPQGKRKGTGQVMVWKFYYGWFTILQKRWVIIRASLIRVFYLSKILNKRKLPQNEARMGGSRWCLLFPYLLHLSRHKLIFILTPFPAPTGRPSGSFLGAPTVVYPYL